MPNVVPFDPQKLRDTVYKERFYETLAKVKEVRKRNTFLSYALNRHLFDELQDIYNQNLTAYEACFEKNHLMFEELKKRCEAHVQQLHKQHKEKAQDLFDRIEQFLTVHTYTENKKAEPLLQKLDTHITQALNKYRNWKILLSKWDKCLETIQKEVWKEDWNIWNEQRNSLRNDLYGESLPTEIVDWLPEIEEKKTAKRKAIALFKAELKEYPEYLLKLAQYEEGFVSELEFKEFQKNTRRRILRKKRIQNYVIISIVLLIFVSLTAWIYHRNVTKEERIWTQANKAGQWQVYINKFPEGQYIDKARDLQEKADWIKWRNMSAYEDYIQAYPEGKYVKEARAKLTLYLQQADSIEWHHVVSQNTPSSYEHYLKQYPEGAYVKAAQLAIREKTIKWDNAIGKVQYESGRALALTSKNSCYVVGSNESDGWKETDFWVCKVDSTGKLLWDKTFYGGGWKDEGYDIIALSEGGCLAIGFAEPETSGKRVAWVMKLHPSGTMIWQKKYDDGYFHTEAHSVTLTRDGGFMIGGIAIEKEGDPANRWILRLDAKGNKVWSKRLKSEGNAAIEKVIRLRNGAYLAVGGIEKQRKDPGKAWAYKFTDRGTLLWNKVYGGKAFDWVYDVKEGKNQELMLVGQTRSKGEGNDDIWVLRLDTEGRRKWDQTYGSAYREEGRAIAHTADNSWLIAGLGEIPGQWTTQWEVAKINDKGELFWLKEFEGKGKAEDILICPDQSVRVVGSISQPKAGNIDLRLVCLD